MGDEPGELGNVLPSEKMLKMRNRLADFGYLTEM